MSYSKHTGKAQNFDTQGKNITVGYLTLLTANELFMNLKLENLKE